MAEGKLSSRGPVPAPRIAVPVPRPAVPAPRPAVPAPHSAVPVPRPGFTRPSNGLAFGATGPVAAPPAVRPARTPPPARIGPPAVAVPPAAGSSPLFAVSDGQLTSLRDRVERARQRVAEFQADLTRR